MALKRILLAVDHGVSAACATDLVTELAQAVGAEVAIFHAIDPKLYAKDVGLSPEILHANLQQDARELLAIVAARLRRSPPPSHLIRDGDPKRAIVAVAREWNAHLVVVGTHGRSGVSRLLLGSTAEYVVRHAPCPVLVARRAASPTDGEDTGQ